MGQSGTRGVLTSYGVTAEGLELQGGGGAACGGDPSMLPGPTRCASKQGYQCLRLEHESE
jgi:hypothetical protein